MRRRGTPGTFRRHCFQSCVYSDETTWRPRWKIPIEHPWRRDFRDSKFQNVPRCLGPQKRAPLVRVPKPPTIHYQPAIEKRFDSPAFIIMLSRSNVFTTTEKNKAVLSLFCELRISSQDQFCLEIEVNEHAYSGIQVSPAWRLDRELRK